MTNAGDTQIYNLSESVQLQGQTRSSAVCPLSVSQGVCSLHTCWLSCRSLLCAGGPLPPAEEARLLPHPDLHPSHHGCGAVTGLLLDQQGVCSCSHCRRYPPPLLPAAMRSSSGVLLLHDVPINTTLEVYSHRFCS